MTSPLVPAPIDLCILDFDQCLFPGISKVQIAIDATWNILTAPQQASDRLLLPYMARAAIWLFLLRSWQKMTRSISDGELVEQYQKKLGRLPLAYYQHGAERVVNDLYPGALESLNLLISKMPCGVISLTLTPVLDALNFRLNTLYGAPLSFKYGNSPFHRPSGEERYVLTGEDKKKWMVLEMERCQSTRPLVIGKDHEDIPMALLARQMGGLSIGFNAPVRLKPAFDLNFSGTNWYGILNALKTLFPS